MSLAFSTGKKVPFDGDPPHEKKREVQTACNQFPLSSLLATFVVSAPPLVRADTAPSSNPTDFYTFVRTMNVHTVGENGHVFSRAINLNTFY